MVVVVLFAVPIIASFFFIFNYLAMEDELSLILHPLTLFESIFHRADIARFTSQNDFDRYVAQSRARFGPSRASAIPPFHLANEAAAAGQVGSATALHRRDLPQQMSSRRGLLAIASPKARGSIMVAALPPTGARVVSRVAESGGLLLTSETVLMVSDRVVSAYDVSRPEFPSARWQIRLDRAVQLQSAEVEDGTAYLLLAQNIDTVGTCPTTVAYGRAGAIRVDCRAIEHPTRSVLPADILYTLVAVDPVSGSAQRSLGFLAPSRGAAVRLFAGGAYLAYTDTSTEAYRQFYGNFFSTHTRDLLPFGFIRAVEQSERARGPVVMASRIARELARAESTMTPAARGVLEQQLQSRFREYVRQQSRGVERTVLAKVRLKNFFVEAGGSVDGAFAGENWLDEANGNIRIVTSVDSARAFPWLSTDTRVAEFDLSVLGGSLQRVATSLDIAPGTRQGIEFSGAGAYVYGNAGQPVVMIDLSAARKIGAASLLPLSGSQWTIEPISGTKAVLSVSPYGTKTMVSLLDVGAAHDLRTASPYLLNEPWPVIRSHYASTVIDPLQRFLFLQGGHRGYVFEFSPMGLRLVRTVEQPVRATISLEGFLYLLGDGNLTILNEQSWEVVHTVQL